MSDNMESKEIVDNEIEKVAGGVLFDTDPEFQVGQECAFATNYFADCPQWYHVRIVRVINEGGVFTNNYRYEVVYVDKTFSSCPNRIVLPRDLMKWSDYKANL